MKRKKIKLFLDSGAFSLYTKIFGANGGGLGVRSRNQASYSYVDSPEFSHYLDSYCDFILENKKFLWQYCNLDIMFNPEATYKVQQQMEAKGCNPIPVFHYGNGHMGDLTKVRSGDKMYIVASSKSKAVRIHKKPNMNDGQGLHGGVKWHSRDGKTKVAFH